MMIKVANKVCKFKVHDNIRWYEFCLGSVSKHFVKYEQIEIYLNGTVYDFSVARSSIKKLNILNIHEYFMVKNNIKYCLGLSKKCLLDY